MHDVIERGCQLLRTRNVIGTRDVIGAFTICYASTTRQCRLGTYYVASGAGGVVGMDHGSPALRFTDGPESPVWLSRCNLPLGPFDGPELLLARRGLLHSDLRDPRDSRARLCDLPHV